MRKLLPNKPAGLLGSDEEDILNSNGILALTSLKGLSTSDKQDRPNQRCILTLLGLNGLLGSD